MKLLNVYADRRGRVSVRPPNFLWVLFFMFLRAMTKRSR